MRLEILLQHSLENAAYRRSVRPCHEPLSRFVLCGAHCTPQALPRHDSPLLCYGYISAYYASSHKALQSFICI